MCYSTHTHAHTRTHTHTHTLTLTHSDVIFGNESEAEAFATSQNYGTSDLAEIALRMSGIAKTNASRSRIVVITHGAEPTIIAHDGNVCFLPHTHSHTHTHTHTHTLTHSHARY